MVSVGGVINVTSLHYTSRRQVRGNSESKHRIKMYRMVARWSCKSLLNERETGAKQHLPTIEKSSFGAVFSVITCVCQKKVLPLCPNSRTMAKKYVVMAEEGERELLTKAREQLGLDLSDAEIIFTGVGAINIIRSLQSLDRDAELYNIGYAGSANFDLGTWVEVSEVRLNHPNVTYPEPRLSLIDESLGAELPLVHDTLRAICYTNTDFVLASDYKDCVFDMELAFIAALGFTRLHSLKYVSDNLSLHTYHELTHGVE